MHDGTTLIVDVLTLGENSYALSLPAEDLWVAYEVVRRHVDANGVRHYSQMIEAKTTSDGYSFKFDTGDTFTCASHLDKPTSSTLSDEIGGGSGGGGTGGSLTVTISEGVFDKTWQEVKDAVDDGLVVQVIGEETIGTMTGVVVSYVAHVLTNSEKYIVSIISSSLEDGFAHNTYECSAADGYPEMQY